MGRSGINADLGGPSGGHEGSDAEPSPQLTRDCGHNFKKAVYYVITMIINIPTHLLLDQFSILFKLLEFTCT